MSADASRLRAAIFAAIAITAGATAADAGPARLSRTIGAAERASLHASLVYVREDGGRKQVWTIRADGTGERRLTSGDADHFPADVTRDGGSIAVIAARGATEQDHTESLALVDARTGRARATRISASRLRNPTFSPSGAKLAFEADGSLDGQPEAFRDVFVSDASGAGLTRLTHDRSGSFQPAFTSDGDAVLFAASGPRGTALRRVGVTGGEPRAQLSHERGDDFSAKPSPDGARLAFVSARGGADRVWIAGANGESPRPISPEGAREERDPSWSPDGSKLTFTQRTAHGARVLVWDAARGVTTAVTDGANMDETPSLSPDGQYVVYASTRDGKRDLWLSRADGSARLRLAGAAATRWRPLWVAR